MEKKETIKYKNLSKRLKQRVSKVDKVYDSIVKEDQQDLKMEIFDNLKPVSVKHEFDQILEDQESIFLVQQFAPKSSQKKDIKKLKKIFNFKSDKKRNSVHSKRKKSQSEGSLEDSSDEDDSYEESGDSSDEEEEQKQTERELESRQAERVEVVDERGNKSFMLKSEYDKKQQEYVILQNSKKVKIDDNKQLPSKLFRKNKKVVNAQRIEDIQSRIPDGAEGWSEVDPNNVFQSLKQQNKLVQQEIQNSQNLVKNNITNITLEQQKKGIIKNLSNLGIIFKEASTSMPRLNIIGFQREQNIQNQQSYLNSISTTDRPPNISINGRSQKKKPTLKLPEIPTRQAIKEKQNQSKYSSVNPSHNNSSYNSNNFNSKIHNNYQVDGKFNIDVQNEYYTNTQINSGEDTMINSFNGGRTKINHRKADSMVNLKKKLRFDINSISMHDNQTTVPTQEDVNSSLVNESSMLKLMNEDENLVSSPFRSNRLLKNKKNSKNSLSLNMDPLGKSILKNSIDMDSNARKINYNAKQRQFILNMPQQQKIAIECNRKMKRMMKNLMNERERIKKLDKGKVLEFRYRKSMKLQELTEKIQKSREIVINQKTKDEFQDKYLGNMSYDISNLNYDFSSLQSKEVQENERQKMHLDDLVQQDQKIISTNKKFPLIRYQKFPEFLDPFKKIIIKSIDDGHNRTYQHQEKQVKMLDSKDNEQTEEEKDQLEMDATDRLIQNSNNINDHMEYASLLTQVGMLYQFDDLKSRADGFQSIKKHHSFKDNHDRFFAIPQIKTGRDEKLEKWNKIEQDRKNQVLMRSCRLLDRVVPIDQPYDYLEDRCDFDIE